MGTIDSRHMADVPDPDFWWDERLADALFAERVQQGRCGNCGVFNGPTHRCPPRAS
jgi:hypothetical protein